MKSTSPSGRSGKKAGDNFFIRLINSALGVILVVVLIGVAILSASIQLRANSDNRPADEDDSAHTSLEDEGGYLSDDHFLFRSMGDKTCTLIGLQQTTDSVGPVLVIPATAPNGDTVVSIEDNAFLRLPASVHEVQLPETLTRVGQDTFPASAKIYRLYNGMRYLGNEENPYMVLLGIADTLSGSYALHPDTRIVADESLAFHSEDPLPDKWRIGKIQFPANLRYVGRNSLLQCSQEYLELTFAGSMKQWLYLANGRLERDDLVIACADGWFYTSHTAVIHDGTSADGRKDYDHVVLGAHSYVSGKTGNGDTALFAETKPIKHLTAPIRRSVSGKYTMFPFEYAYPFGRDPHVLTDEEMETISMSINPWTNISHEVEQMVHDYMSGELGATRAVVAFLLSPPSDTSPYIQFDVDYQLNGHDEIAVFLTPIPSEEVRDTAVDQLVILPIRGASKNALKNAKVTVTINPMPANDEAR